MTIKDQYKQLLEARAKASELNKLRIDERDQCIAIDSRLKNAYSDQFPESFKAINKEWYDAESQASKMETTIVKALKGQVCQLENGLLLVPIEDESICRLEVMKLMAKD